LQYLGTRIGRVRVIFSLPKQIETYTGIGSVPVQWPKAPLAYVEWYSKLTGMAEPRHGMMYRIKKITKNTLSARAQGDIIPLTNIRQSCMLFPLFPSPPYQVSSEWSSINVLDLADTFFVNNWLSKYSYQTLW